MAGAKDQIFKEKITPYLQDYLSQLRGTYGEKSSQYQAMASQYVKNSLEDRALETDRMRHYQSEMHLEYNGMPLKGVERLYKRTILLEPSTVCAAHCRWCLRGQYPMFSLKEEEITNFAKYCGSDAVKNDLKEVLITGGDPLMVPKRLSFIFSEIKKYAPNIQFFRIGTRVPVQDPQRVNNELLDILQSASPVRVEIATHINHPLELTESAREAYQKLYEVVFKIYDQTVLLKNVNDSFETLSELYDQLRYLGIEAHYLFHCIPMRGMAHHRTSVQKGLDLAAQLTSSGYFSGRTKPMFTLMTDLGKVTLYQGTVLEKNKEGQLLIQTRYRKEDFQYRNPSWALPESSKPNKGGFLQVWYPDGGDE